MRDHEECIKCPNDSSCNFLVNRFRVEHCDPNKKAKVEEAHKLELEKRASINTWSDKKNTSALDSYYRGISLIK